MTGLSSWVTNRDLIETVEHLNLKGKLLRRVLIVSESKDSRNSLVSPEKKKSGIRLIRPVTILQKSIIINMPERPKRSKRKLGPKKPCPFTAIMLDCGCIKFETKKMKHPPTIINNIMGNFDRICEYILESRDIDLMTSNEYTYGMVDNLMVESFQLVCEETLKLHKTVNEIFDEHFKDLLISYLENPEPIYFEHAQAGFANKIFTRDHTKNYTDNPTIKEANDKNPVALLFGITNNFYDVKTHTINIGINPRVIEVLGHEGIRNSVIMDMHPNITYELTPEKLKQSIGHELTHWIEDSLYKNKMKSVLNSTSKKIDKTNSQSKRDKIIRNFRSFSEHEIQAIVNGLSVIRDEDPEKYDKKNWSDLLRISPSIKLYFDNSKDLPEDERREVLKNIFRRLFREDLLTKKMIDQIKLVGI